MSAGIGFATGTMPRIAAGSAILTFRRSGAKTVLESALARSPLRLLSPRNHGDWAWIFLANLGGGLVDGDRLGAEIDVGPGAAALLSTQASTKVYRSPRGCRQEMRAVVADGASLALLPDPVVCFAGARYSQALEVALAPEASIIVVDGYTCGRSARGERWAFAEYASRTLIRRANEPVFFDATRLDPADGTIADRMGRFDVVLSLLAIGPKFAAVADAMLAGSAAPAPGDAVIVAASPVRGGAILRVAAERYEHASRSLRSSFAALARILGDDPFSRKW